MKKATRAWKVYGVEGHRQRESFCNSYKHDFSNEQDGIRIIEVFNSDKTGTNEYTIVRITRNTFGECERELDGQITDGIFENSRTGIVEEITDNQIEHWTMDTFGAMLPDNWEEICEAANAYIDEHWWMDREEQYKLWERWCAEDPEILEIIPAAQFEEVRDERD